MKKLDPSKKDAIIITLFVIITGHILTEFDVFEIFVEFAETYEEYELDELFLILLIGSFGGIWYSIRRYKEIKILKQKITEYNEELQKDNFKKDELLLEQAKMVSLGEMIENIAHQWRQPLAVISASASGLQLQKDMDILESKDIDRGLDNILNTSNYLSETIDSFRNYARENNSKKSFFINQNINRNLDILESSLKLSNIKLVLDLDKDIEIDGFPNEVTQVFMNIINNSKDALDSNKIKDKYIFLSKKIKDDYICIEIYDNANGIDEKILNKIFEPYFTTKHQSKGTGLGLYMVYKIVKERIKGEIEVSNVNFTYKDEAFKGAKFLIKIPIK